jgi:hypothetical protein
MICPISQECLVDCWAHDLSAAELDEVEEHLFGCAACFQASSRIAAFARALASVIPPIATGHDLALATARGVRHVENDFLPGVANEAWLHPGTDLLIHRLIGDLTDVEKISVAITLPDGKPIFFFPDAPFDPSAGVVLIACQREFVLGFADITDDIGVIVTRVHRGGRETVDRYEVHHRIG